jgi:uncharacterized tellurite resistance protein B-like protein
MTARVAAMVTWVGALARGEATDNDEREGEVLARKVLGADGLAELRSYFASQPTEIALRERRGAIAACIWMARADRDLAREEDELLSNVIAQSELPFETQMALLAALADPWPPEKIAAELTQPGLRELMLALAWRVAEVDHAVDASERKAFRALAEAFGIDDERAKRIRELT